MRCVFLEKIGSKMQLYGDVKCVHAVNVLGFDKKMFVKVGFVISDTGQFQSNQAVQQIEWIPLHDFKWTSNSARVHV